MSMHLTGRPEQRGMHRPCVGVELLILLNQITSMASLGDEAAKPMLRMAVLAVHTWLQ